MKNIPTQFPQKTLSTSPREDIKKKVILLLTLLLPGLLNGCAYLSQHNSDLARLMNHGKEKKSSKSKSPIEDNDSQVPPWAHVITPDEFKSWCKNSNNNYLSHLLDIAVAYEGKLIQINQNTRAVLDKNNKPHSLNAKRYGFCPRCDKKLKRKMYSCGCCKDLSIFPYVKCSLCNKELCYSCRIDANNEPYVHEWYCSACLKVRDEYLKELDKAEERHCIKIRQIQGKYIKLSVRLSKTVDTFCIANFGDTPFTYPEKKQEIEIEEEYKEK